MKRSILKAMAVLFAVVLMASVVPTVAMAAVAEPVGTAVNIKPVFVPKAAPKAIFPAPGVSILIVTDAETGLPVAGAKYDLYRDNPFDGADSKVGPTYTTNNCGKITVSHTWSGDFYWVAAGEVEGYAADTAKHAFKIVGLKFAATEIALEKPAPVEEEPVAEEPAIAEEPAPAETEEAPAAEAEEAPAAEAEVEAAIIVGGWSEPEDAAVTEEVKAAFDQAVEGLLGVDYTPVAVVGTQLVAGTNYCVLCECVVVAPEAEPYYALVYFYEDLEGNATLTNIKPLSNEEVEVSEDGVPALTGEIDIADFAAPAVEEAAPEAEAAAAPEAEAAAPEAEITTEETTIG
ncbi:MAG: hypothetical protein K6A33_13460 [Clostridiales bacterium]|nr:hypothetical protein [Clostridiales bacterium]